MEVQFTAITRGMEMLLAQLYYWARRVTEQRNDPGDGETAGRMLGLATENLERFVTTLLDCFRPMALVPQPTSVSQLVAAVARCARDDQRAASVIVGGGADETVLADEGQLQRVWPVVLRRLVARTTPGALHVMVVPAAREGRRGVEISVRRNGAVRTPEAPDVALDLEWELARRIVDLHAGELTEQGDPRERIVVVFLPTR